MIGDKALTALCLVSLSLAGPQALAQSTAAGAEIYARTCGRCHYARSPLERSDREWSVIMLHMRIRAGLTGKDAKAVQDFLVASNRREAGATPDVAAGGATAETVTPVQLGPSVDPALAAEGRAVAEQFGCGACHAYAGSATGTLGPALNGVLKRRGADYVIRKVADPRFDNPNSQMPQLPLTAAQRRALVEFLRTVN